MQSATDSASDGAVITFSAGTFTWTATVNFSQNKGVTYICASQGACTITASGNPGHLWYNESMAGTNNKLYRWSGFVFDSIAVNNSGLMGMNGYNSGSPSTVTQIRIDHNDFHNMADSTTAIFFGDGSKNDQFYGVVDHNTFTCGNGCYIIHWVGYAGPGIAQPTLARGTINNMFFEDNTITFTGTGGKYGVCSDSWGGANFVFRHNTSTNCYWASHGVQHAGGPQNFEYYNNSVSWNVNASGTGLENGYHSFHHQGSGSQTTFNNTIQEYAPAGKAGDPIATLHYRSSNLTSAPTPGWTYDQCDGTSVDPPDGNRSPTGTYRGYPCWHQPGRDFLGNLIPIYFWNNKWADGTVILGDSIEGNGGTDYISVQIVNDRDVYQAAGTGITQTSSSSPFNGTTGTGFGIVSRRPSTCTATTSAPDAGNGGVGYFATDVGSQGTLYTCTTTNIWTATYVPFTYPHPLVGGSGGSTTATATLAGGAVMR